MAPRSVIVTSRTSVANVVRSALVAEGHDVSIFESLPKALAAIAASPPNLIVAELDSVEDPVAGFAEKIRSQPGCVDLPIVVLAGFLTRPEKSRLLAASFDDVVVKPVSPERIRMVARRLASSRSRGLARGSGKLVLAVDDSPMLLKLMRINLAHAGFEVITARDGAEALALARDVVPDAVLSDVLMPGLDGFELCRALRNDPRFSEVPVVLVSAHYVQEGDLELARRAGASSLKLRTSDYAEAIEAVASAIKLHEAPATDPSSPDFERLHHERSLRQLDRQTAVNRGLAQLRSLEGALPTMVAALSRALHENIDFGAAVGDALATILDTAELSRGAVFLADQSIELVAHRGFEPPHDPSALRDDPVLEDVLKHGEVVVIASTADPEQTARLKRAGVASELFVPLLAAGQIRGAMYLASDSKRLAHDDWISFVRAIGIHFGQAIGLSQTSRRMSASERALARFFELSPGLKIITDETGHLRRMGRSFESTLDHPREALLGTLLFDLIHVEDRERARWSFDHLDAEGYASFRVRCRRGDGGYRVIEWIISKDPESSSRYGVGVDVTERERNEAALAASEEKFRSLVENMPDIVSTFDEAGNILFVSANVERVSGYSAREISSGGLTLWQARIDPEHASRVKEQLRALFQRGQLFDEEYRLRRKDGAWIWIHARAVERTGNQGEKRFDALLADVTQHKKLEAALLQSQRLQLIGQLTGGIAHDFNNMLSVVLVNAESLASSFSADDPRLEDATEVRTAAERAAGLARQLLAFGRDRVFVPKIFDLGAVPSGMEKMLKSLLGEDIHLKLRIAPGTGSVNADFGQIEQVVMNLVVNARDAVRRGGTILVETENVNVDAETAAAYPGAKPGPHVAIVVRDDGAGMSYEVKRRLFEPFFTTKEQKRGAGLGLATVLGIVGESGGLVTVESEVQRGTAVHVLLPRVELPRPTAAAIQRPMRGTETILLIEDDEAVRGAATRVLKGRGYRVLTAKDAAEAAEVEASLEGTLHLVLSDVVVCEASGPEIVQRLRAKRKDLRVVFMSGYTEHADVREAVRTQGAAFLQKPFTPDSLSRKVREVLDE